MPSVLHFSAFILLVVCDAHYRCKMVDIGTLDVVVMVVY